MIAVSKRVRIAAVADTHCHIGSAGTLQSLFAEVARRADILLVGGDLTDNGLPEEARVFVEELVPVRGLPVIVVLGNHDYHNGKQGDVTAVLQAAGLRVLDGDAYETHGIGFAGVKGFMGGFGRRLLEPWGEDSVKLLVQEAVAEAEKLDAALTRLQTPQRVALLHYAPIDLTVDGEPPEIFPFLGCSRLEAPLDRHRVAVAVHGHAHHGRPEGRTTLGIPVYNVSLSLLKHSYPDVAPFRVLELAVGHDG